MIKVMFSKNSEWLSFYSYEEIISYLKAKAGSLKTSNNDSNVNYKKHALKRIKKMYGVNYENKNQTDKEFVYNLCCLGEIAGLIELNKMSD